MKKFNMKSITNRAWEIVRGMTKTIAHKINFKVALKRAWREAKEAANKPEKIQLGNKKEVVVEPNCKKAQTMCRWENYGKRRMYLDRGYVDLNTGKIVKGWSWETPYLEKFVELYAF